MTVILRNPVSFSSIPLHELSYIRLWFVCTTEKEHKHSRGTCTAYATDYYWPTCYKNSSINENSLSFVGLPTTHHWIKALHPLVEHLHPTNIHYQEPKMPRMISLFEKLVSCFNRNPSCSSIIYLPIVLFFLLQGKAKGLKL